MQNELGVLLQKSITQESLNPDRVAQIWPNPDRITTNLEALTIGENA